MAGQASPHIMFHDRLGYSRFGHISVACGTVDIRAVVRRMLESHQSLRLKAVDSLPGDFPSTRCELHYLFNFGLVGCELLVAEHAFLHRRDAGVRTSISAYMAVQAVH